MSERFALLVETACRDFETLRAFVCGEISVVRADSGHDSRAEAAAQMALAKSFIAFTARARRILDREAASVPLISRLERTRFLRLTQRLSDVRDAGEHGYERDTRSPIAVHFWEDGVAVDDSAMVIDSPDSIRIGSINLALIYPGVDRVRNLAGFATLS